MILIFISIDLRSLTECPNGQGPPEPMLVCHCNGVSDRTVRRMIRNGARTASQVGEACGAGTCCGGCVQTIDEIIHAESSASEHEVIQPVPLPLARPSA